MPPSSLMIALAALAPAPVCAMAADPASTPTAPTVAVPATGSNTSGRPQVFEQGPPPPSAKYDSKWNQFQPYLMKLIDAMDARWVDAIKSAPGKSPSGVSVAVTFVLNDRGVVTSTKATAPNVDDVWVQLCLKTVRPEAELSYGVWSAEMVAALGRSQELTLSFGYR